MIKANKIWLAAGLLLTAGLLFTGGKRNAEPLSQTEFMLNTFVTVTLYDKREEAVIDGSMELCRFYEGLFSKTIESSEVWKLNHRGSEEDVISVSADTAGLLEKGLHYSRLSDGRFDITVEPLSSLWNFNAEKPVLPSDAELAAAARKVGYENLEVKGNQVIFRSPETRVDLGAIAKGYIADRMKEYLLEHGVKSAVINLGGNVLCIGKRPDGSPFKIGLQKPFEDRNEVIASLEISDMSVVSSGVYERHFVLDGVNYHHILNPDTGYPYENGLIAVTIISKESADGDGLSTACFSVGLDEGLSLINSLEGVYAVFITDDYELHFSDGAEQFL